MARRFGRPDIQLNKDGAVWCFSNEVTAGYLRCIRGLYAAVRVATIPWQLAVTGPSRATPLFWVVVTQCFTFSSMQTRLALLADPGGIIAAAERKMARAGPQSGAVSRRQF
jgi:hypothetical protein